MATSKFAAAGDESFGCEKEITDVIRQIELSSHAQRTKYETKLRAVRALNDELRTKVSHLHDELTRVSAEKDALATGLRDAVDRAGEARKDTEKVLTRLNVSERARADDAAKHECDLAAAREALQLASKEKELLSARLETERDAALREKEALSSRWEERVRQVEAERDESVKAVKDAIDRRDGIAAERDELARALESEKSACGREKESLRFELERFKSAALREKEAVLFEFEAYKKGAEREREGNLESMRDAAIRDRDALFTEFEAYREMSQREKDLLLSEIEAVKASSMKEREASLREIETIKSRASSDWDSHARAGRLQARAESLEAAEVAIRSELLATRASITPSLHAWRSRAPLTESDVRGVTTLEIAAGLRDDIAYVIAELRRLRSATEAAVVSSSTPMMHHVSGMHVPQTPLPPTSIPAMHVLQYAHDGYGMGGGAHVSVDNRDMRCRGGACAVERSTLAEELVARRSEVNAAAERVRILEEELKGLRQRAEKDSFEIGRMREEARQKDARIEENRQQQQQQQQQQQRQHDHQFPAPTAGGHRSFDLHDEWSISGSQNPLCRDPTHADMAKRLRDAVTEVGDLRVKLSLNEADLARVRAKAADDVGVVLSQRDEALRRANATIGISSSTKPHVAAHVTVHESGHGDRSEGGERRSAPIDRLFDVPTATNAATTSSQQQQQQQQQQHGYASGTAAGSPRGDDVPLTSLAVEHSRLRDECARLRREVDSARAILAARSVGEGVFRPDPKNVGRVAIEERDKERRKLLEAESNALRGRVARMEQERAGMVSTIQALQQDLHSITGGRRALNGFVDTVDDFLSHAETRVVRMDSPAKRSGHVPSWVSRYDAGGAGTHTDTAADSFASRWQPDDTAKRAEYDPRALRSTAAYDSGATAYNHNTGNMDNDFDEDDYSELASKARRQAATHTPTSARSDAGDATATEDKYARSAADTTENDEGADLDASFSDADELSTGRLADLLRRHKPTRTKQSNSVLYLSPKKGRRGERGAESMSDVSSDAS